MSNETDLGWLARNVHNWPAGHQGWCYVISNRDGTKGVATSLIGQVDCPWVRIEKQEWLARRAGLQNKPSWDDFGESAKFMAQDSDGAWMAFESEPAAKYHVWGSMRGWCGYAREGRDRCRGEVLGDWRDTLEKRPEEFQPFTSIEDNQEQDMTQHQAMKQDNGWLERGELPPVGVECEHKSARCANYSKVFIAWHGELYGVKVAFYAHSRDDKSFTCSSAEYFRPIRTEREVAIEEMCNVAGLDGLVFGLVAGKLYDAGYRKESK